MLTARTLAVGMVATLALGVVYPNLRAYLGQQAELNQTRRDLAEARAEKADLENEMARWDDPAYVTSQARTRLSFVMPGERAFRVVDADSVEAPVVLKDGPAGTLTGGSESVWYEDIWQSVTIAGESAP
jgi:cell division protein FtsB